jgi:hypothetical protein
MIRGDSLCRILPGPGRPYPACRSARRRSAEHCGGIATNLNRFESLQRNPDRRSRTRQAGQGGGGSKSLQLLGRVTARGSRAVFLWPPKLLIFLSKSKNSNGAPAGGGQKSGAFGRGPCGRPARIPAKFGIIFFQPTPVYECVGSVLFARASPSARHSTAAKHSKKTSRNSGWGG